MVFRSLGANPREKIMIRKLVLIAALAVMPAATFAQSNSGAAGGAAAGAGTGAVGGAIVGGPVGAAAGAVGGAAAGAIVGGIAGEHRTEFRAYVTEQRVPSATYREQVVVGATLPDTITYREVPKRFGKTQYRYTVVNDRTVLVEPRTRRIVQIIE
jgi:predicted lipid-binding transport protein (Tim44 family)